MSVASLYVLLSRSMDRVGYWLAESICDDLWIGCGVSAFSINSTQSWAFCPPTMHMPRQKGRKNKPEKVALEFIETRFEVVSKDLRRMIDKISQSANQIGDITLTN